MGIDEYDAMQEARKAALRSAANFLESVDRTRQARKRVAALFPEPRDDDGRHEKRKGDFLFDLLRLNARYLNQLSALGSAHSRIAHQALERLYSAMVPASRQYTGYQGVYPGEVLDFSPTTRTAKFVVECVDPNVDSATLRWRPLEPAIRAARGWLIKINGASVAGKDHVDVDVEFGVRKVISVTVTDKLPIARRYTSEIFVDMGPMRRCIPVALDFRPEQRDES
jgi:hypothetical protein